MPFCVFFLSFDRIHTRAFAPRCSYTNFRGFPQFTFFFTDNHSWVGQFSLAIFASCLRFLSSLSDLYGAHLSLIMAATSGLVIWSRSRSLSIPSRFAANRECRQSPAFTASAIRLLPYRALRVAARVTTSSIAKSHDIMTLPSGAMYCSRKPSSRGTFCFC